MNRSAIAVSPKDQSTRCHRLSVRCQPSLLVLEPALVSGETAATLKSRPAPDSNFQFPVPLASWDSFQDLNQLIVSQCGEIYNERKGALTIGQAVIEAKRCFGMFRLRERAKQGCCLENIEIGFPKHRAVQILRRTASKENGKDKGPFLYDKFAARIKNIAISGLMSFSR